MPSGGDSGVNRRGFLKGVGAALTVGMAGCSTDSDPNQDTTGNYTTTTSEPEYELDFSLSEIDLTDLDTSTLDEYTAEQILEEGYTANAEYKVLENGEETNLGLEDLGNVVLETEDGEQLSNPQQIPEHQIENKTEIKAKAEINGQTLEDTATVKKQTPEAYLVEAYIDGEPINDYSTPFKFDTHNVSREDFNQKRLQEQKERTGDRNPQELVDPSKIDNILSDDNLNEKEKKRETIRFIGEEVRDTIGESSALAETQASFEELILREHTPYQEIYASGFDNPAEIDADGNNHGTKAIYIDGDWYHHETIGAEVTHIDNVDTINMTGGVNDEYVSILAEFEKGNMEELEFDEKNRALNQLFSGQTMPGSYITSANDLTTAEVYGMSQLERIRNNTERNKVMDAFIAGGDFAAKNDIQTAIIGDETQSHLLAANQDELHQRIDRDPDFQNAERIIDEALG